MTTTEITAEERAQLDALPVADADLDADPAVAEIEARIVAGDDTVTAEQLAATRAEAAGRVRFARLRALLAERTARRDAEQVEREQAEAAIEHARAALAGHTDEALVPLFDAAEEALRALVQAAEGRNRELLRLVGLPRVERVRGVDANAVNRHGPWAARVPLPEGDVDYVEPGPLLSRLLNRADIGVHGGGRLVAIDRATYPRVEEQLADPKVVARGRARLAERD